MARRQAEPPQTVMVRVEALRRYVHDFLRMAAEMVMMQGKAGCPYDHDVRGPHDEQCPELGDDIEDSENEEWANGVAKARNALDKLLDKDAVRRDARKDTRTAPYAGHEVVIDELQRNWEDAIRKVRREQAVETNSGQNHKGTYMGNTRKTA